jgi:hypothetical protein
LPSAKVERKSPGCRKLVQLLHWASTLLVLMRYCKSAIFIPIIDRPLKLTSLHRFNLTTLFISISTTQSGQEKERWVVKLSGASTKRRKYFFY